MIKKLKTYDSDNLQIGGKNEQISRENSESFFWKEKYYRIWNKLYKASMMGMNVGNGGDFESSGEKYAMGYVKNLLKNIDKPVLFDVGANRGIMQRSW